MSVGIFQKYQVFSSKQHDVNSLSTSNHVPNKKTNKNTMTDQKWQLSHEASICPSTQISSSLPPLLYSSLHLSRLYHPPPPLLLLIPHAVIRAERSVSRPSEADQPTLNISHYFKWAHMNYRSQGALFCVCVSVYVCVCWGARTWNSF